MYPGRGREEEEDKKKGEQRESSFLPASNLSLHIASLGKLEKQFFSGLDVLFEPEKDLGMGTSALFWLLKAHGSIQWSFQPKWYSKVRKITNLYSPFLAWDKPPELNCN